MEKVHLVIRKYSVPKSKKVPMGSFPKCTRENSANVKLSKNRENVQSSITPTKNTKWAEMLPKYKSTIVKLRENHLLENVDSVRKVMFIKVTVETIETGKNSVRKIDDRSHQIGSQKKRKRLEEICEEKPINKKFGIRGGVLVRESNLSQKNAKTPEGGGGGNVKNVF